MHACTIIAKNYLAQARVLAESFLEHNPGSSFSVLVIDAVEERFEPADESFTVLSPADIACEPFERMAARYDVLELSTAVKPWLLRQQLGAGAETITYLDPDIQVFGSLEHLHQEALSHGLVLTPHNTSPIPDDGHKPTQVDIMIAGVYNLGYLSIGHSTEVERLIDWWCDRLTRDCRVDPTYGYFVDQRWFDLAPGFVSDFSIVREPEYNVAYWNAHSRELTLDDGHYAVDGRPLAFFHFSGFDPAKPDVLSRHQTRVKLGDHPALARISAEYGKRAVAAGYWETRTWPYTWATLANGEPMSSVMRAVYAAGEDERMLSASPFSGPGCRALLRWAIEQDPSFPEGINRALAQVYRRRADLRAVFADLEGDSRPAFLDWARESAVREFDLPESLIPVAEAPPPSAPDASAEPAGASAPVPARPPAPVGEPTNSDCGSDSDEVPAWPQGVNVIGYFRSELGVGEAARQAVSGLDAVGVPLLPMHGATIPLSRQGHSFDYLEPSAARYPVNLICMNADALPDFARRADPAFFADRYSVGLWFWEVAAAPAHGWSEAFALVDEVWAPTAHVAGAIRSVSPIPVVQVRLPIEFPSASPLSRAALGIPDGFMFLFSFDYLSVFERKNPMAVVEAYLGAFGPGDGATLVIKCINQDHDVEDHERLLRAVRGRDDVVVIDRYLDPADKNGLTATCDCYVSLHRSEGLGLTMAEAMYHGKPVIATGYSGNLDFMTDENSYLIDYAMVDIGPDAAPYPPDGQWADPDVAQASAVMRELVEDPRRALLRGQRAAASVRETHSAAAAGETLRRRLDAIYETRDVAVPGPLTHPHLRGSVHAGPTPPPRSSAGPAGPALRQAVLRAVRPLSAFQNTVNQQVLDSVEALDSEIGRLRATQALTEATDLPEALRAARAAARARAEVEGVRQQFFQVRREHDALAALHEPVVDRLDALSAEQQKLEAERRALPYMAGDVFVYTDEAGVGRVQGYTAEDHVDDVYRSFEDVFRGSEEFIRDRQRRFLPLLEGHEPVLDLGCGRGEMLDLLREAGVAHVGVDSDEGMVRHCHAKGHAEVELGDGIAYLERCEPASLGAVFAAQVIEHLPYEALLRFFELSHRALAGGGVLVAETVNPHSPPALKAFWVDLTHQHPIFPEVALALARSANFARGFVFHPNGGGDIEVDRYTTGEYAVVAYRGAEDAAPAEE